MRFVLGLLSGLLASLLAVACLMAAFISSDLDRFQAWLDAQ